jgi:hypothetical protein
MVVGPSGCGKSSALAKFLDIAAHKVFHDVEKVLVIGQSLESPDNRDLYNYNRLASLFPLAASHDEIHLIYAKIFDAKTVTLIQETFNPPTAEQELSELEAGGAPTAHNTSDEIANLSKEDFENLFHKDNQAIHHYNEKLLNRPKCLLIVEDMDMHASSRTARKDEDQDEFNKVRGFLGHRVHHFNTAVIICKVTLSGTGGTFWVEQSRQFLVPLHRAVPFSAIAPIFRTKTVLSLPRRVMEDDYIEYVSEASKRGDTFLLWTTNSMMDIRREREEFNHLPIPFSG